jgi:hypothetical protein
MFWQRIQVILHWIAQHHTATATCLRTALVRKLTNAALAEV